MKQCKKCLEWKPLSDYSHKRAKGRKPGLQPRCKVCASEDTRIWRNTQSPERLKDLYYLRNYGMTLHDFNTRFIKQHGKCLLCKTDLSLEGLSGNRAVVDHCHVNGHVRGILCNECNRGLGYFKDNKETLMNAIKYLAGEDLTPEGGQ